MLRHPLAPNSRLSTHESDESVDSRVHPAGLRANPAQSPLLHTLVALDRSILTSELREVLTAAWRSGIPSANLRRFTPHITYWLALYVLFSIYHHEPTPNRAEGATRPTRRKLALHPGCIRHTIHGADLIIHIVKHRILEEGSIAV